MIKESEWFMAMMRKSDVPSSKDGFGVEQAGKRFGPFLASKDTTVTMVCSEGRTFRKILFFCFPHKWAKRAS